MPSFEYIHQELKKKGVTLQLLWYSIRQANPEGYQHSQFCHLYHQWAGKLDICLRQQYRAGEKLFVDYAGDTRPVQDPVSGVIREAQLFVATLVGEITLMRMRVIHRICLHGKSTCKCL